MIDKKWNNERKRNTPLVLNSEGEILWIPGFPPSESFKISSDSPKCNQFDLPKIPFIMNRCG